MSKKMRRIMLVGIISAGTLVGTGCSFLRPYNTPEFQTIQANQTAFLIPLVGDTTEQGAFESETLLAESKVATKEVQIPKRWVQTGRASWQGEWRPSARLIVVERSAVTREWTDGTDTGTSNAKQGVTAKTKDGIKVTLNVNATALIEEANATKYLYYYNTRPLEKVMDTEIKTIVHSLIIEEVGKVTLEKLDAESIMEKVRKEVGERFSKTGITISALGLASEPILPEEIQKAMNDKIKAEKAQQTQAINNKTAEDKAKSEAEQMRIRQETFQKTLELRELEVIEKAIEAWKSGGAQVPEVVGSQGVNVFTGNNKDKK